MVRPSILCPIDFSEPSRGALRFAALIAEHFFAGLTVVFLVRRAVFFAFVFPTLRTAAFFATFTRVFAAAAETTGSVASTITARTSKFGLDPTAACTRDGS